VPQYRIYKLNSARRIVAGEWIQAADDVAARAIAHAMCDETTPFVELWQAARRIGVLPCETVEKA
jgi:hypothetical protein